MIRLRARTAVVLLLPRETQRSQTDDVTEKHQGRLEHPSAGRSPPYAYLLASRLYPFR